MILVDPRDGGHIKQPGIPGPSEKIVQYLIALGLEAELYVIKYGDARFEGLDPSGTGQTIQIGIERKTLHDMLHCIDDARYNQQRIGMAKTYKSNNLIVEGLWRQHEETGILMESRDDGKSWFTCNYRSRPVDYSKLYRYLISVQLSGVSITYSRNIRQTAYNIHELFWFYQKRKHTSLLETQKLNIPTMRHAPTLTRMWAADIEGVGVQKSLEAEALFRSPIKLATSQETDWLKIANIGVPTAKKIIAQINGWKQ